MIENNLQRFCESKHEQQLSAKYFSKYPLDIRIFAHTEDLEDAPYMNDLFLLGNTTRTQHVGASKIFQFPPWLPLVLKGNYAK